MKDVATKSSTATEANEALRSRLLSAVLAHVHPRGWKHLDSEMSAIGTRLAEQVEGDSKERILTRTIGAVPAGDVVSVAVEFVRRFPFRDGYAKSFDVEEALARPWTIGLNKRVRREIAGAIGGDEIFVNANGFMSLVRGLFPLSVAGGWAPGIDRDIERHVIENQDWDSETLFERIGAFDVSERRFADLVEGLLHCDVRPDDRSIRSIATRLQRVLANASLELREVGVEEGYPAFRFVPRSSTPGRPKNLIFASKRKPDLRLVDALNNHIEVVSGIEDVLIFDREFPAHGLLWCDVQAWYAELCGIGDAAAAKVALYNRLRSCLPGESPPQRLLFEEYHRFLGSRTPACPALLPEVWLHWDPKHAAERGSNALPRFRMDFLLLLPGNVRVVVEVDGRQHYADGDSASPRKYAEMAAEDRALRLAGYEVYRFGATELDEEHGPGVVSAFVERLFKRHRIDLT